MPLDFPSSPTNGQVYGQWLWDGAKWGPTQPIPIVGPGEGDITAVYPGNGLIGGGFSGDVTLALQVPVSVANGGTGATTPAGALFSLGAAPILSPDFIGDPRAPTPALGDNDTSIATTAWVKSQNYKAGGNVTVSETAPVGVSQGDLWWNSTPGVGELFINYFDGNSTQWVIANPRTGPSGPPGEFQAGTGLTINYSTTPPTIAVTTPYLPLTGGHLTGRLYIDSAVHGIAFPSLSGGDHGFAFSWSGSNVLMYVDNNYVGTVATTAVTGAYLPLTGGQLSGRLQLSPAGIGQADLVLFNGSAYTQLYNDGAHAHYYSTGHIYLDRGPSSQVWITGSTANCGLLIQSAASGSYCILYDDGNTHFNSTSTLWMGGQNFIVTCQADLQSTLLVRGGVTMWSVLSVNGTIQDNNGRFVSYRGDGYYPSFCCWLPGYAAGMFLSGTDLCFGNMDAGGTYVGPLFASFNSGGRFVAQNGITCPGNASLSIYGGTFYNAFGNGWLYFDGSLHCWDLKSSNNVQAANALYCGGMYWQNNAGFMYTPYAIKTDNYIRLGGLDISNNSNCLYAANLWSANDSICAGVNRRQPYGSTSKGARIEMWYGSDWDSVVFAMGGGNFLFSPNDGASGYYVSPTPFSDGRLKADIRDTEIDALAAVMATPVRAFSWNAEGISLQPHLTDPHVSIGFVAQEVEETMPSAVEPSPFGDHTLHILDHNMTPYLVRAIQQLAARVAELEAK